MANLYQIALWTAFCITPAFTQRHVNVGTSIEAAAFALNNDHWTSPQGEATISQSTTTSGLYNISAQLCFPTELGENANTLQLATHGLHFDSRYWDPQINGGNQSYVEAALQAGYSILTYDRLGAGESDHPDGYDVVQAPLQLEILRQLTLMARNGTLYDIARTAPAHCTTPSFHITNQPRHIVHVGHSFGSFLTSAFIAEYPSLTDGALLTGYVLSKYIGKPGFASWALESPSTSNPSYVRPAGYLLCHLTGIQNIFFGGNPETAFTPDMLSNGNVIKHQLSKYTGVEHI